MKAIVALSGLALAACTTVPPTNAGPTAGFGQVAYTNGLRVRPIELVEDSRCPANVQCVWAGRLVIRADIIGGSWHEIRDLELGKPQRIADGTLTLVAAMPQKQAGAEIDPRAHRFTFDFQGGI